MLDIQNLHVEVDGKPILKGLDLKVNEGETHALFGQNGSGKTTLVLTIMGFPRYHVSEGRILFKGEDITHLPVNERARLGIGISFQHPPAIHGVKLKDLVDIAAKHGTQPFNTEEVAKTINSSPKTPTSCCLTSQIPGSISRISNSLERRSTSCSTETSACASDANQDLSLPTPEAF